MRKGGGGDAQVREMMARADIERLKRHLLKIGGGGPDNNGFAHKGRKSGWTGSWSRSSHQMSWTP